VPCKIGRLTVKTGSLAQGGIQMEQGIAAFPKEKGNAAQRVELLVADTGGNPAGAKAQEAIERDKVNVILGPLAAFELLAITDYVRDQSTPLISLASAEDVPQRKANPFVICPSATSGQCRHAMGDYSVKRMATISDDFAFGPSRCRRSSASTRMPATRSSRSSGRRWCGNVDGAFNGFAGSNPEKFMRAYADLGLKAKIALLAGWTGMDDALLRSLGDEAVGVVSAS
jgi:branched-chain amino acid transport system substrate-binding protein